MSTQDTIIALATAPHNAALGIIRISGPNSHAVLQNVFRKTSANRFEKFLPRQFYFGELVDESGDVIDQCLAVFFNGPHSATGEDAAEIHAHGNLFLLKNAVRAILALPADLNIRAAQAGEFTKRAYLNGKIDLAQAEAVHELITADSDAALKGALGNLDGRLSQLVAELRADIQSALASVEAGFEFSEEEDVTTYDASALTALIDNVQATLSELEAAHTTSKLIDHGISVALVGRPNVGKSSLLNALLVEERAIVTPIAGTTRDVIEGSRIINGIRFIFRDTAGLRESGDVIEAAGIERSQAWMRKSDIIFFVTDTLEYDPAFDILPDNHPFIFQILNKIDVFSADLSKVSEEQLERFKTDNEFDAAISALSGFGLEQVENILKKFCSVQSSVQNNVHINERQYLTLQKAQRETLNIKDLLVESQISDEVLAEELRILNKTLGEITGEVSADEVLGEIFSKFCIGK